MSDEVGTVGIVGVGTIGASLAAFYASKGMEVRLFDSVPENREQGMGQARLHLATLARFGLVDAAAAERAAHNLVPVERLEELGETTDLVHEAAAEQYEVKTEIFARLDQVAPPEVILASSSSGLLMTRIQEPMRHPERSLIAHPFNPPHLIPLVELVRGERTDAAVVQRMHAFYTGLGKKPVVLQKEVPGHIANRLAAALWREALDLVARGVASVADVDQALCAGPGLRWALMGQHLIYHLGGGKDGYAHFIDHIGTSWSALWQDMATWTEIPEEAREAALAGIGEALAGRDPLALAAWRDAKLVELLKAIHGAAEYPMPSYSQRHNPTS